MLVDLVIIPTLLLIISCSLLSANAGPFGAKPKVTEIEESGSPVVDLSDEELLSVMEDFAFMSEEEKEEAFSEVLDMVGDDSPEMLAAMREVMDAVKTMDGGPGALTPPLESTSVQMELKKEIAEATGIALEMVSLSNDWELVHRQRHEILDSLVAKGKVGAAEEALFRSDDSAWGKELRMVWDGLKNLAKERDGKKEKDEL